MARAPIAQDIEAAPEADRLEGVPHPRATPVLYGHATAERQLRGDLCLGPHASRLAA